MVIHERSIEGNRSTSFDQEPTLDRKTGAHFVSDQSSAPTVTAVTNMEFLGFPTSHEYSAGSGRAQEFEPGDRTSGSGNLRSAIRNRYCKHVPQFGRNENLACDKLLKRVPEVEFFRYSIKGTAYWTAEGGTHCQRRNLQKHTGRQAMNAAH